MGFDDKDRDLPVNRNIFIEKDNLKATGQCLSFEYTGSLGQRNLHVNHFMKVPYKTYFIKSLCLIIPIKGLYNFKWWKSKIVPIWL